MSLSLMMALVRGRSGARGQSSSESSTARRLRALLVPFLAVGVWGLAALDLRNSRIASASAGFATGRHSSTIVLCSRDRRRPLLFFPIICLLPRMLF